MFGKWKLEHPAVISVLLALCVVAIYSSGVFLEFTNYDDTYYVTENRHIRGGLNWETFSWAWTHTSVGNWQPMTLISHALDCQIHGLNPAGHHLTNVVFHGANTVILFLLLRGMTGATWRSAAVAVLFALHPLRVESVAWVSERKDVLSGFFGLLSLLAYVGYVRRVERHSASDEGINPVVDFRQARSYYVSALGLFALGLMSKPMLVTWPCVMLLLDYWPLNRLKDFSEKPISALLSWRLFLEKIPFIVLASAVSVITFLAQRQDAAVASLDDISVGVRVLNALNAYARYIGKTIWPTQLAPIYPYVQQWPWWEIFGALLLVTAVTAIAIWKRKERPYLPVGWAWYLGTLVPVIGLVQVGNQSMADRYTYLPIIGLLVMVVWMVSDLCGRVLWRQAIAISCAVVAAIANALVTQKQLMYWQNTETLFRHTLEATDNNYIAWNSLAFYFADLHESKQAEQYFRMALKVNPRNRHSLERLASVLIDEGRFEEAETNARLALEMNLRSSSAYRTLGLALMKQGRATEAAEQYYSSLQLEPDNATTHYNLANALARLGQYDKARGQYEQAVLLDASLADAHNNLGYMYSREGKLNEAISEFRAALALKPGSSHARYGLGDALARAGRPSEAADEFLKALEIDPRLSVAQVQLNRMAWIFATNPQAQFRDGAKALQMAERLFDLTGRTNAAILETVSVAQAEIGRFDVAINSAAQARKLALETGQNDIAQKADELLEAFKAGKPYREMKR